MASTYGACGRVGAAPPRRGIRDDTAPTHGGLERPAPQMVMLTPLKETGPWDGLMPNSAFGFSMGRLHGPAMPIDPHLVLGGTGGWCIGQEDFELVVLCLGAVTKHRRRPGTGAAAPALAGDPHKGEERPHKGPSSSSPSDRVTLPDRPRPAVRRRPARAEWPWLSPGASRRRARGRPKAPGRRRPPTLGGAD